MKQKRILPKNKNIFIISLSLFVIVVAVFISVNVVENKKKEELAFGSVKSDDYLANMTEKFDRPEYQFTYPNDLKVTKKADSWEIAGFSDNIILREEELNKYDDQTILSLVPQFVSPPTNIEKSTINNFEVTTAEYQIEDTSSSDFKMGDKTKTFPAYGYVVTLPKLKLFFFYSGKNAYKYYVFNDILSTLTTK